ncbi:hypothetical protein BDN71DRAFT_773068 [Pleurotus eryngii]|uniref:Uncharacterized protein n=1 Tax=Pleurotus eryngii TaxID=5323 RepID=A0A9P5ZYE7_PLEER|nr:hypothetical protein BDN71DRAFT_773068 [Pleurotus eryngii]
MATNTTAMGILEAVNALYTALAPISYSSQPLSPQAPRRTGEDDELRRILASPAAPLATGSSFGTHTVHITNEIHINYLDRGDRYGGTIYGGVVGGRGNHNIHIDHSAPPEDPSPVGTAVPVIMVTAIILGVVSVVGWYVSKK